MGINRVFFPQPALDRWLQQERVEFGDGELLIRSEGRRYRLAEAVRVVAELTGTLDPFDLVGKVKTAAFVSELGAELLDTSMVIGENAYEVIPGWVGAPIGAFEPRNPRPHDGSSIPPSSDEQLLVKFLMRSLA
ncbi:MAG TPA: hypothetical protein VF989_01435 [Polyangiaceae bacterium]|jgi:hypothetical protein